MENLMILSNLTGMPDWVIILFVSLVIIALIFFSFDSKKIEKKLLNPNNSVKNEELDLIDFCVQELQEGEFYSSEQVAQDIIQKELIVRYCGYTRKPVAVNNIPELGEKVFEKLKQTNKED